MTHSNATHSDRRRRQELAARYLDTARRMAATLARRLPAHVDVDDLIGAAGVALAKVLSQPIERTRAPGFDRYIKCRMRGAMLDELRRNDTLSNSQRADLERLRVAERRLTHSLGHTPDRAEVASAAGLTKARCEHLARMVASRRASSLDAPTAPVVATESSSVAIEAVLDVRRRFDHLHEAMLTLPDRLQRVLQLYYRQEHTLRQIGTELGVTESRALQLRQRAEQQLRNVAPESAPMLQAAS
jgi:RNA polymerase sigma factor FliA